MKNPNRIVRQADELARAAQSWADLSNALFNPVNGLISTAFPTRAEREEFAKTEQYKKTRRMLSNAIDTHGLVEGECQRRAASLSCAYPSRSISLLNERRSARASV
jgi:hypothetical protein